MPHRIRPVLLCLLVLSLATLPALAQTEGTCVADADTICLLSGRFSVEVNWDDTMSSGLGQVMSFGSDNSGSFFFHDPKYLDLRVTVLNGCLLNDHYWVLAQGLSDDEQLITITDTVTAAEATYTNTQGDYTSFADTEALACDPPFAGSPTAEATAAGANLEGTSPPTITLVDGRFELELQWQDFSMTTGDGQPVQITSHSGAFGFFGLSNLEVVVKLFNGTAINGSYWVLFADTTEVEYTLKVTDTCYGTVQSYTQPLSTPPATTVDSMAFIGPDCGIFEDGFESGDTSTWSAAVP